MFNFPSFSSLEMGSSLANEPTQRKGGSTLTPFLYLSVMWASEIADQFLFFGELDRFGLHAQQSGPLLPMIPVDIVGVILLPFLHGGWAHIISNTIAYIPLALLIQTQNSRWFQFIFWFVAVLSGLASWAISPLGSVGVGASGVVFGMWGFCLSRCLFKFTTVNLLVAGLTFLWFGSLWKGAIPWMVPPGISWQGHLTGAIAGVLCACVISKFGNQLTGEN